MQVKQMLVVGALALATGAAFAQEAAGIPLSRARVDRSVLAAGAAGRLTPPGQDVTPGYGLAGPSHITRAAVRNEVLQASAAGTLVPPGGGSPGNRAYRRSVAAPSSVTRNQVESRVLEASAEGALIPAGQGEVANPG